MSKESTPHSAVRFALEASESAAVDWGAKRVLGPRGFAIYFDQEGNYELEIDFEGSLEAQEARDRAIAAYRAIRETADIPLVEPEITGFVPYTLAPVHPSNDFIEDAEDFFNERHFRYTVIAAQIACEAEIRTALEAVVTQESGALGSRLLDILRPRSWSLLDAATQRAFSNAGHAVTEEAWWSTYRAHVERRNNITHRSADVTEDDARKSLDAMWKLVEYMRLVRQRYLGHVGEA